MHAKNLVKVTGTGKVKGRKRTPTLRKLSFKFRHKRVLLKHVVLIMRIFNVIINMDDIRQERSDEGPTLKLNKRFK